MRNIKFLAAAILSLACVTGFGQDTAVQVGNAAPDFVVTGIDGSEFKVLEKLGKNKHVVLMFSRAHW